MPETPTAEYVLSHEPDGMGATVRENLVDIVERELLGPRNGPEEVLLESPRQLYLVGHIAPVKLDGERLDDRVEDAVLADVQEESVHAQRGVPAAPSDDNEADSGDDAVDDRAPKQGLMVPASMGLRFQVPEDLDEFTVKSSWGTYQSEPLEGGEEQKGRPRQQYRRTPCRHTTTIRLADLVPGRTAEFTVADQVKLRVDRFDDPTYGRRLLEIALCNDRVTPVRIPVNEWLFQTRLQVEAGGAAVFLPVRDVLTDDWPEHDEEVRRLDLQYRDRLEFAVGRTCSVDWTVEPGARRATAVWTSWLPTAETPQVHARSVEDATLGMAALAEADADALQAGLAPLINGYGTWLAEQRAAAEALPSHLRETADVVLHDAARAHQRLAAGLACLTDGSEALRCFQFMNRVMNDQRKHSLIAAARNADEHLSIEDATAGVVGDPKATSTWRPFQLAFILMQLPALTDPTAPARSGDLARVELLFFPTGGGKTEAYLGLAAFTFAMRRREGPVAALGGELNGADGVAVLMRYTLRLLTAQQFQRATAMVCAAELLRREDEQTWGVTPFRIGLWVGTDVSPKRWDEAKIELDKVHEPGRGHRLTVLQIQRCPWCGTPISPKQVKARKADRRVLVFCGDDLAQCPFAKGRSAEGLPVLTVDEEIYRLTPAFVIATVDKFARLAREGEAAALFGYVSRKCGRHGYVHPDYAGCAIKTKHNPEEGLPAATAVPTGRLRPPDLIIQDELHLITGALGTAVGLFEVVVETMATWQKANGTTVKPLIVASTATVRNAEEQVRGLYGRRVEIFPPQVLDVADTFFSREVPPDAKTPGRRYIGVCAQGVRLSSAEIRVAEVLLLAGQTLLDRCGAQADPYMTLVGYFNATRELAGMARYVADDVQTRVGRPARGSGFPRRVGAAFSQLRTGELTSRIASRDIAETLDQLAVPFDPDYLSTQATLERIAAVKEGKKLPPAPAAPFDVVLATSMLQVGVDVQRLGLMLVVGQPKNTAEYIQASSRVGRDPTNRPGLVVSLGNWARPRDLAHFEQFRHYHETFYKQVEALSVTPFSPTSLDRGIDGVLVGAARVSQAHLPDGLSPEANAGRVQAQQEAILELIAQLNDRILASTRDEVVAGEANDRLHNRLQRWTKRHKHADKMTMTLVYEKGKEGQTYPLMISPEKAAAEGWTGESEPFVVAHSMREVQPEINLLVSPVKERMFATAPDNAPAWVFPMDQE
ncbi:DISARM system helicase DrmA [Actinoplanes sp. NPDC049118]|uniref:DISARM system helicase DrmA n=1 Tax=Actinoplanes sp. NPDC049118 TaxID=3155769 RepID=UPI003405DFC8